eukprot:scaffold34129_cov112-Isochrysis_galbana.AAC.5
MQPFVRRGCNLQLSIEVRDPALQRVSLRLCQPRRCAVLPLMPRLRCRQRVVNLLKQPFNLATELGVLALQLPYPLHGLSAPRLLGQRHVQLRRGLGQGCLVPRLRLAQRRGVLECQRLVRCAVLLRLAPRRSSLGTGGLQLRLHLGRAEAPRGRRLLHEPQPHRLQFGSRDELLTHRLKLARCGVELRCPPLALLGMLGARRFLFALERLRLGVQRIVILLQPERLSRQGVPLLPEARALIGDRRLHVCDHRLECIHFLLEPDILNKCRTVLLVRRQLCRHRLAAPRAGNRPRARFGAARHSN